MTGWAAVQRRAIAIFLIAFNVLFTPAAPALGSEAWHSTDDAGTPVRLARPAQRIVTLAPNLAELVVAAGAQDRLRAVARYTDHPEPLKKLPLVGDAFAINLEAIARLRPDLVLVWLSGTPERQREALKALARKQGFAVFESEIRSVQGIADTLERIGALTGTAPTAQARAQQLRADWAALQARGQGLRPVRVFYQVWDAPLMTFNREHLVSEAIRVCGGVQGFDTLRALTPTVGREAVLRFDPELILSGDPSPAALQAWKKLPHISAVKRGQLRRVDGAVLTRMGPRFVQSSTQLCQTIEAARAGLP